MMKDRKFVCAMDRRSRCITCSAVALIAVAVAAMYFLSAGDYLPAWTVSMALILGALCALSVPRYVKLGDDAVEIHCTVEITELPFDAIRRARVLPRSSGLLPIAASFGFFGYFGFFLDVENWDIVRLYTGSMRSLVEIEDIFERRYVVGVSEPQAFVSAVTEMVESRKDVQVA